MLKKIILLLLLFASLNTHAMDKILVVASSENSLELREGKSMAAGYFLNELAVPAMFLKEHGYEIVLATPKGNTPAMDARSNNNVFFGGNDEKRKQAFEFTLNLTPIPMSQALSEISSYSGIFVPGGHAPMNDLMQNREFGEILKYAHNNKITTAFICHGPAAILSVLKNADKFRQAAKADDSKKMRELAQDNIYRGYRLTAFSDAEEWPGEVKHNEFMPFHLEDALLNAGFNVEIAPPSYSHIVIDRELVTGQNPASDHDLAEAMLETLKRK